MSPKIKHRRLRKTNQNEEMVSEMTALQMRGKSILLDSTKKCGSTFSPVMEMDFDSVPLSSLSPKKADGKPGEKVRRRKIRNTQDLNQLSSSMPSQDSNSSIKIKTKRTKKFKKTDYILPKIVKVVENPFLDATLNKESTLRRKSSRKIIKSSKEKEQGDSFMVISNKGNQFKKEMQLVYIRPEEYLVNVNKSLVDTETFDFDIQSGKVKMTKNLDASIEKNGSKKSVISVDQGNLEVDVTNKSSNKSKQRRQTKKDKSEIMDPEAETKCIETNKIKNSDTSIKRRKRISNKHNLSNKETDVNNSFFNEEVSIKLMKKTCSDNSCQCKKCASGKLSIKQKINIIDDSQRNNSNSVTAMDSRDHKKDDNDDKRFMFIDKKRDVCNSKSTDRTSNQSEAKKNRLSINRKQNRIGVRCKSLASNFITSPVRSKRHKAKNIDTIELKAIEHDNERSSKNNIGSEDHTGSDDIFDRRSIENKNTKAKRDICQIMEPNNTEWNDNTKIETGKSIHFLSPEDKLNSQRDTSDIKENSFDVTILKSVEDNFALNVPHKHGDNIDIFNQTFSSFSRSQNIDTKSDDIFEIDKSIVSNQSAVQYNEWSVSQPRSKDIELPSPSLSPIYSISSTASRNSANRGTNASVVMSNFSENIAELDTKNMTLPEGNRRETFQMGRNRSFNFKKSVIDLITPKNKQSPKNIHKDSSDIIFLEELSNEKMEKDSSMKLNRRSTYSKTVEVSESEIISEKSTSSPLKLSNSLNRTVPLYENIQKPSSKLNRTAIYVKDDIQEKDLLNKNYASPLLFDTPNVIDSSKVNKRKRWDKSLVSVSFLDSTDIENISIPWKKDVLNVTWENSRAEAQVNNLKEKKGIPETVKDIDKDKDKESGKKNINFESPIVKKTVSCYRTPLSKTSTPLSAYRHNLSRQVFLKDKQKGTINETKNSIKVIDKPITKSVRIKMPNFALIHQRAYDKLENLKEMSERKAARAKLLLSGHKPTDENSLRSPSKSKKFLQFSPVKSKTVSLATSINESRKKAENSMISDIVVTKIKNVSPSKSNPKVVNKENKLTPIGKKMKLLKSSQIPKPKVPSTVVGEKKGFTKYGFKVRSNSVKTATKEEQMKAISTKTKITKNTVQERRNVIQGVRSNRRFELLMSMRNK